MSVFDPRILSFNDIRIIPGYPDIRIQSRTGHENSITRNLCKLFDRNVACAPWTAQRCVPRWWVCVLVQIRGDHCTRVKTAHLAYSQYARRAVTSIDISRFGGACDILTPESCPAIPKLVHHTFLTATSAYLDHEMWCSSYLSSSRAQNCGREPRTGRENSKSVRAF